VIRPFGEAALLVELGTADRAGELAASLRAAPPAGVVGVVPGLESVLVELDPLSTDASRITDALQERIALLSGTPVRGRLHTIPVAYGGEGLVEVASLTGLTEAEVAEMHAATELRVLFCGFAPGFAYLGDLRPELRVERLATPRTHTPAGSVAIAGSMSGIYPADLPGGWRVIGRSAVGLFDPRRDPPALLLPGDRVRFESLDA